MEKVIHTPTLEEFKKIVKQALDDGYEWRSHDDGDDYGGDKKINGHFWKNYKKDAVVYLDDEDITITYGSKQWAEEHYSNDPNYLLTWLKPMNTINITGLNPETIKIITQAIEKDKQAIEKDKQENVGEQINELLENRNIIIIKDKNYDYRIIITPLKNEDGNYINNKKSIKKWIASLGKSYYSKSEIEEFSKEYNWEIHYISTFEELIKLNNE